jgi:hypothetical protein
MFGVPLAPHAFPQPVVVAGELVVTSFGMVFNVNQLTLRQAITPPRLMGRMNSVVRLMYWGTIPAGAAIGGALASWIGLRPTLWVEAVGATMVMVPLLFSPLHRLQHVHEAAVLA